MEQIRRSGEDGVWLALRCRDIHCPARFFEDYNGAEESRNKWPSIHRPRREPRRNVPFKMKAMKYGEKKICLDLKRD